MHLIYDLENVGIESGIKSDHSIITLSFQIIESQSRGRGFWKFNNALLKDPAYVHLINSKIQNFWNTYQNFENKAHLWYIIKCQLRTITISYDAFKAKETRQIGQSLQKDLNILEISLTKGKTLGQNIMIRKESWKFTMKTLLKVHLYFQGLIGLKTLRNVQNTFFNLKEKTTTQNTLKHYIKAIV